MKKTYVAPAMVEQRFALEDIITTSSGSSSVVTNANTNSDVAFAAVAGEGLGVQAAFDFGDL